MNYEIKQSNFEDKQLMLQLVNLQKAVYPNKIITEQSYDFWYNKNPMGHVVSFNAFLNNQMVAHYACIPVKMKIQERIVKGLLDIATATHPQHRGKGLFRILAQTTFDYAREQQEYEFIIGVANGNSFPGYMKYFNFKYVAPLDVKFGFGHKTIDIPKKTFSFSWNSYSLKWRLSKSPYKIKGNVVTTNLKLGMINNIIGIKAIMAFLSTNTAQEVNLCLSTLKHSWLRPLNLYIGLGVDFKRAYYFNFPKFIKRSPFHLIFMDLTDGNLPEVNRDNIFFQLMDFDVI